MRTQALVVLMAVLAAPGGGAQELEVPRSGALDLEAVAAAQDPGPQDPIGALVPDWILAALPEEQPGVAAARDLLAEVRTLTFGGVPGLEAAHVLLAARAFLTLENAVVEQSGVDADAALELLTAYRAMAVLRNVDVPTPGRLGPLLRRLAPRLQMSRQRAQELIRVLRVAGRRAERLFARLAASLLRGDLDPGQRARLLLAVAFGPDVDRDTSVRCAEAALTLLADAEPTAWLQLSRCYVRGRDIPRAEVALQRCQRALRRRASEAGAERSLVAVLADARAHYGQLELEARLVAIGELQKQADGEGIEAELAQAELFERMDDEEAAELAYRRLRDAYPHDARPVTRLAQNAFVDNERDRAQSYLKAARRLQHHDTLFYVMSLLLDLLPRLSQEMGDAEVASMVDTFEEHVVAIAAAEPAWGEVLRHLRTVGVFSVGALERPGRLFRRFGERFAAVEQTWRRHPEQLSAYRLVLAFAPYCPNRGRAQRALLRPLPEGCDRDTDLARWRAQSYLLLQLMGEDALDQEALDGLLDDLVRVQRLWFDALLLRGTGLAAAALRDAAEGGGWDAIESTLQRALPPPGHPRRALAFNNWGFALLRLSRREEALEAWSRAMGAGDPDGIAELNVTIARARFLEGDAAAPWCRRLEQMGAAEGLHPTLRAQAWSWTGWLAERDGRDDAAREAYAAAVRTLDESQRPTLLSPLADDGVHATGETRWGLAVGPDGDLKLIIYTDAQLWLLQPAPLTEAELRRKAR